MIGVVMLVTFAALVGCERGFGQVKGLIVFLLMLAAFTAGLWVDYAYMAH